MAPHFKNPNSYLMSHLALYLKDQFTIITSEFGKLNPCHIKKEEKKRTKTPKNHPTEEMWPSWLLFVCLAAASSCTSGRSGIGVCHHCSLLTAPPQLADIPAQRESGWVFLCMWPKSFWPGVLRLLLSEVWFLWSNSEIWKPPPPTPRHQDWNLPGGRSRVMQFWQMCHQVQAVTQNPF